MRATRTYPTVTLPDFELPNVLQIVARARGGVGGAIGRVARGARAAIGGVAARLGLGRSRNT